MKVGLVGYGYWGVNLGRVIAEIPSLELATIVDASDARLTLARANHPSSVLHQSFKDLLADPSIEAVVLATPASTHHRLGGEVLSSGRHLFVEKPLALDVASAEALVQSAERHGCTLMVGHTFLYSPAVQCIEELIREGALGELRFAHSERFLGQPRDDCNVLWDLAAHDISILLHLGGEFPDEVVGHGFHALRQQHADSFVAALHFPSGWSATVQVGWVNPTKRRLFTLVGTKRMISYDDVPVDQKVLVYDAGMDAADLSQQEVTSMYGDIGYHTRAGDIFTPQLPATEPLRAEMEDFSRACRTGTLPIANGRFGLDVVRVLEGVTMSDQASGSPVELVQP